MTTDYGFKLKKSKYSAGETVQAVYGMIFTDTSYSFYADSPDVFFDISYENGKGYIITFTMPEHDVKLMVSMTNDMVAMDKVEEPDIETCFKNAKMIFNYYETTLATDGGGSSVEYAIYDYGNRRSFILAKFTKSEGDKEKSELCWSGSITYRRCLELVEKYDMRHWNNETSLDGARYVVRMAYGQEILRFSSDAMAKNGMEAFSEISKFISGIWSMYAKLK